MRYLGIDYGEKRIGIAVSDPAGKIAFPQKVIFNRGNVHILAQLKELIDAESVSKIIVGLPLGSAGQDTEQTAAVRKFTEQLRSAVNVPLEFENELLTTHLVEQAGVKKEHTDEAAAALILQSYLDRQNNLR